MNDQPAGSRPGAGPAHESEQPMTDNQRPTDTAALRATALAVLIDRILTEGVWEDGEYVVRVGEFQRGDSVYGYDRIEADDVKALATKAAAHAALVVEVERAALVAGREADRANRLEMERDMLMVERDRPRHAACRLKCEHCGKPATCFGSWDHGSYPADVVPWGYSCDDCCNHITWDGECRPIADGPLWLAERLMKAEAERDALAARVAGLEAALQFYADPFNRKDEYGEPLSVPDFYSEMVFGETARAALTAPPAPENAVYGAHERGCATRSSGDCDCGAASPAPEGAWNSQANQERQRLAAARQAVDKTCADIGLRVNGDAPAPDRLTPATCRAQGHGRVSCDRCGAELVDVASVRQAVS